MSTRFDRYLWVALLAVSLAVNLSVGIIQGLDRPMESDSYYYLQLATSLAEDGAYVIHDGFWPDAPSLRRMPGWPGLVAVGLKAAPAVDPSVVMRVMCLVTNALTAMVLGLLTWVLARSVGGSRPISGTWSQVAAWGTALAFTFHPTALVNADAGLTEPLFLLLTALGALFLVRGCRAPEEGPPRIGGLWLAGMLALGLACLVRANFVLWIGFFLLTGVVLYRNVLRPRKRQWVVLAAGAMIFLLPALLWAARNARVCGDFPVLSALRGQTFYGGNNDVVMNDARYWGYWIFPNNIPGETPMVELSRTMSEFEVDSYYYDKGKAFIAANIRGMPWLLAGKLVRGYVPVPWSLSAGSLLVAAYRWAIDILLVLGLIAWWRRIPVMFRLVFIAMALTNLLSVLVFYGYSRFAFALEPFFLPFAALGACGVFERFLPRAARERLGSMGRGSLT